MSKPGVVNTKVWKLLKVMKNDHFWTFWIPVYVLDSETGRQKVIKMMFFEVIITDTCISRLEDIKMT